MYRIVGLNSGHSNQFVSSDFNRVRDFFFFFEQLYSQVDHCFKPVSMKDVAGILD